MNSKPTLTLIFFLLSNLITKIPDRLFMEAPNCVIIAHHSKCHHISQEFFFYSNNYNEKREFKPFEQRQIKPKEPIVPVHPRYP